MTDHAAAVEEVRERHAVDEQWLKNLAPSAGIAEISGFDPFAHADRATLLRAYEEQETLLDQLREQLRERDHLGIRVRDQQITTLRAQHAALAPVLDAALAWEAAVSWDAVERTEGELLKNIRAYRAAKETP